MVAKTRKKKSKTASSSSRLGGMKRTRKTKEESFEFEKEVCGPNPGVRKKYSCYSDTTLHRMKELWNVRHPFAKITSNDAKDIWKELKRKLRNSCNRESCWFKSELLGGTTNLNEKDLKLIKYTFAPKAPKEWNKQPRTWLSSSDIMAVMRQYEYFYPSFDFIGPAPLDFDHHLHDGKCVWEELCKFSVEQVRQAGKTKIGIVLNTDYHDEPGQHWIALFIDLENGYIMYFDSTGQSPPHEVKHFYNRVRKEAKKIKEPLKLFINKTKHQKKNTECGMYVMFFIIELLTGKKKPVDFMNKKVHDDEAFQLRRQYFRYDL